MVGFTICMGLVSTAYFAGSYTRRISIYNQLWKLKNAQCHTHIRNVKNIAYYKSIVDDKGEVIKAPTGYECVTDIDKLKNIIYLDDGTGESLLHATDSKLDKYVFRDDHDLYVAIKPNTIVDEHTSRMIIFGLYFAALTLIGLSFDVLSYRMDKKHDKDMAEIRKKWDQVFKEVDERHEKERERINRVIRGPLAKN
jgi:hypothetical protein